jgi:hypothetical protein
LADSRWIVERIIRSSEERDQAHLAAFRRRLLPRETMATLMLGTASTALAIVMLIVTFLGLFGVSFQRWSKPREVMVETTPPEFTRRFDPLTNSYVSEPVLVSAGRIFVPSPECDLLACFGFVLGGIGLAESLRRRKFSWLSAIGFTLMLLMMLIVVACGTLMTLV